ncbi:nuclear transport factor 2 family protein [Streptomyces sp. CAU 1734]|uniref:nuclear transport factor 2 family protein n=1 Tax=Streptomyces sp. CAU 1734 TaxID=3140360 RepID=UPI0032602071
MQRIRPLIVVATAAALLPIGSGTASASAQPSLCASVATAPAPEHSAHGALHPKVRAFLRAYCAWGEAPADIPKYMALFTPTGTLMDTGLAEPIGREIIEAQITNVVKRVEKYRFEPLSVSASPDGRVAFVKARNTGIVDPVGPGLPVAVDYVTMHRLELSGAQVQQGRRFWDQTDLFRPLDPKLPDLFAGPDRNTSAGPGPARPEQSVRERKRAWNTQDIDALVDGVNRLTELTGPGAAKGLKGPEAARAYLGKLFGKVRDLELEPGNTVREGRTTHREWVGHAIVRSDGREVSFGIVERFTRDGRGRTGWDLSFDTLDLVATPKQIEDLRGLIFPRPATPAS